MKLLFGNRLNRWLMVMALVCSQWAYAHTDLLVPQNERTETRPTGFVPFIIGGSDVPSGERTFQVGLYKSGIFSCGGAIIADQWVLTAAHCVDENAPAEQVLSGTNDRSRGGLFHNVAETIIHPAWNSDILAEANDIALIKIDGTFDPSLERVKLATPFVMMNAAAPGTAAVVSGWGYMDTSSLNNATSVILQQAVNPIISDNECSFYFGNINSAGLICGLDSATAACNGDSGGPYTVAYNGENYTIGVVSFGRPECDSVTAYTQVTNYLTWIQQNTGITIDLPTEPGIEPDGEELRNNISVSASGLQNENTLYYFDVPENALNYSVSISGGTGDADLYVRYATEPNIREYDCRPYIDGNIENCTEETPFAGRYFVMLRGYNNYANVVLTASYELAQEPEPEPTGPCLPGYEHHEGVLDSRGRFHSEAFTATEEGTHIMVNLIDDNAKLVLQYPNQKGEWKRRAAFGYGELSAVLPANTYRYRVKGRRNAPYSVCTLQP